MAKRGPKSGYTQTQEHIEKCRAKKIGKSLDERGHKSDCNCGVCKAKRGERKGKSHPSYNKHHSEESIEKMSIGQIKSHRENPERRENQKQYKEKWHEENPDFFRGENNPNWKNGTGNFPYPPGFNRKLTNYIRGRDHNVCQLCGKTSIENSENLSVHHINYDKDDLFELNLIALCRGYNSKVNFNSDMYEDYFMFRLTYGIILERAA